MADFADIFSDIETRMAVLYPDHTRMTDPYAIEENTELTLRQAWGLGITPQVENTFRYITSTRSVAVSLVVSFSRRWVATEHNISAKMATDLLLVRDFETLIDDVWKNDLGNDQTSNYSLVDVTTGDGIQPVFVDNSSFRLLQCNLTVEYFREG